MAVCLFGNRILTWRAVSDDDCHPISWSGLAADCRGIQEPNHDPGARFRCDPTAWRFCLVCIFWLSQSSPRIFETTITNGRSGGDSNSRPSGPKPDALPGCATLRRCFHIRTPAIFQAFFAYKVSFYFLFCCLVTLPYHPASGRINCASASTPISAATPPFNSKT